MIGRSLRVQRLIQHSFDTCIRERLYHYHRESGNFPVFRRLKEDPNVDHGWLWFLNVPHGPVLSDIEFVTAVRVRLRCAGSDELTQCA